MNVNTDIAVDSLFPGSSLSSQLFDRQNSPLKTVTHFSALVAKGLEIGFVIIIIFLAKITYC